MSKKPKIQFLDKSNKVECWACGGKGWHRKRDVAEHCEACDGTGIFKDDNYFLIAETPNGQKIGFQVDGLK